MHFDKHRKSINCLVDVTEAMLNQMEKYNIDTEEISKRPEFTVFIHFLKSILDGELNDSCHRVYIVYEHKESYKNFLWK